MIGISNHKNTCNNVVIQNYISWMKVNYNTCLSCLYLQKFTLVRPINFGQNKVL